MHKTGHDIEELKLLEKRLLRNQFLCNKLNFNIQAIKITFKLYEQQ